MPPLGLVRRDDIRFVLLRWEVAAHPKSFFRPPKSVRLDAGPPRIPLNVSEVLNEGVLLVDEAPTQDFEDAFGMGRLITKSHAEIQHVI